MMNKKTRGAWIFHHTSKLGLVTKTGEFENIETAGKAGILLSALSASEESNLSFRQVEAIAKGASIQTRLELPSLLKILERRSLISRISDRVSVLGLTAGSTLQHTSAIFDSLAPSTEENAVLGLAEDVSDAPQLSSEIAERISDEHQLPSEATSDLIRTSKELGFIDSEKLDVEQELLFNGNLFRRSDSRKVLAVMSSLSSAEEERVRELDHLLKASGCIFVEDAVKVLGREPLFRKLQAIGLYDVHSVVNTQETAYFVSRPAAFGKFGDPFAEDALDLAKAFVVSLKYGMTRSSHARGRIRMLEALLRKLLRGERVGPAPAIGQDYKFIEMKRVVEIESDGSSYSMRLLKKEVGELALQVLTEGDASEQSLMNLPGAAALAYTPPERNREILRRGQREKSKRATAEILYQLRTGG